MRMEFDPEAVKARQLGELGRDRRGPPVLVDHDPAGDRVGPGAQVFAVLEPGVRAQGPEERFLERVLGALGAEPLPQEAVDLVTVLLVEVLEGRDGHRHHLETCRSL